jgi:hypothetical protein
MSREMRSVVKTISMGANCKNSRIIAKIITAKIRILNTLFSTQLPFIIAVC